jgi:DNA-binding NarL/FixJ family response regulator
MTAQRNNGLPASGGGSVMTQTPAIERVLIADDHPMVRGALVLAVEAAFGRVEIQESATLEELLAQLERLGVADLVLLDLCMPGVNSFSGLLTLRANFPETPVAIISSLEDQRFVDEAIALGAAGFIPKSTPRPQIAAALHKIAAGEVYVPADSHRLDTDPAKYVAADTEAAQRLASLTAQQLRVLQLMGTGKLNKQIAYELDIAETTVKVHVSAILQKLNVYSRTQAVVLASRLLATDPMANRPAGQFPQGQRHAV